MKPNGKHHVPAPPLVRCAIYTRKSTEEGLEQDYNTLDAQRDAGENYVKSLAGEGWTVLPERYDDGGFTGSNIDRPALRRLIANIEFGKIDVVVVYKVDQAVWQQVQAALARNGRTGGAEVRNKFGALLRGILRCVPCSAAMVPTHTTRGVKRYRYYVCTTAQKLGWHTCPSKAIPAGQIEDLIVQQIRQLGRDPQLFREVLDEARCRDADRVAELKAEQRGLERDLQAWHAEMRALAVKIQPHEGNGPLMARLAELQDRVGTVEARLLTIQEQIHATEHLRLDEGDVTRALSGFEPIWDALSLKEQTRVVQLLVEQVAYDGSKGKVAITFRPTGIQALARELEGQPT